MAKTSHTSVQEPRLTTQAASTGPSRAPTPQNACKRLSSAVASGRAAR